VDRARHHSADAADGEAAVDGEAEATARRAGRQGGRRRFQMGAQDGHARPSSPRNGEDRTAGESRAGEQGIDLRPRRLDPFGRHGVDFGESHRAAGEAEQVQQI
jgi:hypothetical protein